MEEEFRELLQMIKPHITHINSAYFLNQYRIWLERLSSPLIVNKRKRNVYLRELANQIVKQTLWFPFTETPEYCFVSDIESEASGDQGMSLPRNLFASKCFAHESLPSTNRPIKRRPKSCKPIRNYSERPKPTKIKVENSCPTSRNLSYIKMMENVKNVATLQLESNSWLDMSESNSIKSVNTSDDVPESLEKEFIKLDADEDRILPRSLIKDTNVIVTDLKKTIESLQLRLTETIKQNNDLKGEVTTLQKQISRSKDGDSDSEKKLDVEKLKGLEEKLEEVVVVFQNKVEELRENYETKLQSIQVDKEVGLKEKDQEIARLNLIIEQQCLKMSNEITKLRAQMVECVHSNSNDEKILFLQKCVAKMDRLFHRAEKDYQKQIEKLHHSLEQKDKAMALLLKSQRLDILTKTSAEKQSQFDVILNELEIKYVKMLDIQAQQFFQIKQKYEEDLEYLRLMLDKNSIQYNLNGSSE